MACPLKLEQQEALYIKIKRDLLAIQTAGGEFSLKPYLKSVYDMIFNAKKDAPQAVLIVQSVPDFITAVTTDNQELSDYLADHGLSLDKVRDLSRAFRRDIDNIITDPEIIVQQNDVKLEVALDKKAKFITTKEQAPEIESVKELKLTPSTLLATTGQEAKYRSLSKIILDDKVTMAKAKEIQRAEKEQNILEPRMAFYYDFIKNAVAKLKTSGKTYLTAMPLSALDPTKDLNAHDSDFLNDGDTSTKKLAVAEMANTVVLTVTDSAGNIIRFDDKFIPNTSGKVVYYPMRRIHRTNTGGIDYKASGVQTPQELVKASKGALTMEAAILQLNQEAEQIESVTAYILENKDNKVTSVVTAGSNGYLPFSDRVTTNLSTIVFDNGFSINIPKNKEKFTDPVIRVSNIKKAIPIRGRYLTEEDAEKLASILIDDVSLGSEPIIESDRQRIYSSWLPFKEGDLEYFPDKNLIRIESVILDTTDKTAAKEKIVNFLMAPRIMEGSKPAKYTTGALIWKKGDPLPARGTNFLIGRDEGGKMVHYWNNYRIYNARDDIKLINSLDFSIDKSGKITVSDKETEYKNWVQDKFYTHAIPNAENRLVALNGYLEYSLPLNTARVFKPAAVAIEGTENHAEIARLESLNLLDAKTTEYFKSGSDIPHVRKQYLERLKNLEYLSKPATLEGITQEKYDAEVVKINKEYAGLIKDVGKLRYKINLESSQDGKLAELKRKYTVEVVPAKIVSNSLSEYVDHSGGARGSDEVWDTIGKEFGLLVANIKHYFTGIQGEGNAPLGNVDISGTPLAAEGAKRVAKAAKAMWDYKYETMKDAKLIRNWAQVVNSDAVFAIGTLGKKGDIWKGDEKAKEPRRLLKEAVQGGTGYAVEMAIQAGKPVYVFDQVRKLWYKNIGGVWSKSEVPVLTKNFAGIGTREINEAGKQAIRDVYQKTLGITPTITQPVSTYAQRIRREYPKTVRLYNYDVPTDKLQELVAIKPVTIIPFIEGESYDETIEKLYGEFAGNYVAGLTDPEFSKEEGEFFKNNPAFVELLINDYLEDTRADGKSLSEYATDVLEANAKIIDTWQLDIFSQQPTAPDKVLEGDIFALQGIPVITTNLGGVHGAGLAQAAKNKGLITQGDGEFKATNTVVQLPVKKVWSDSMDMNNNMDLLKKGLARLVNVANKHSDKTFLLPLAGLGHGEGKISDILPLLISTVQSTSNIKLVLPAVGVDLGRQGTVRKDYTRENMPTIKAMLQNAGLLPGVTTVVEPVTTAEVPKDLTLSDEARNLKKEEIRKRLEGKKFNKTFYQKESDIKAAEEQIESAKRWYQDHPLSKYIPFNEMFGIINTVNPNAVAHWSLDGITLFKGSDYSDLYHESWHGFTQLFLTKGDKEKMYKEARKAEGTFTDFKGNTVKFKNASELQLEEFFAEDFRKFMLTGKKTEAPLRRSIFQKLWNILKAMFGKLTVEEVALNKNALKDIHELFDKLSVGDINERSFDQNNANFSILFSGIQRVTPTETFSINRSDSRQMVDLMDNLATEIATESAKDHSFLSEHDYFKDKDARVLMYEDMLDKIHQRRTQNLRNLEYELGINSDPQLIEQLQNREKLFEALVNSYGNPQDPDVLAPDKGAISYHFRHTRFLVQDEIKQALEDQILEESESGSSYIKDKEGFLRTGNETSLEKLAEPEIRSLMKSIFDTNGKENGIGAKPYMRETSVSNILSKTLIGERDADLLYARIVALAKQDTTDYQDVYKQLVVRLGDPSAGTYRSRAIWKKFQHWTDKVMRQLQQLNIHKTETPGEHSIRFGIASGKGKGVEQRWKNGFLTSASTFMVRDDQGYYLDLQKLVKHYGDAIPVNQRIEFLRDLGIGLSIKSDGTEYDKILHAVELDESYSNSKYAVDKIYEHVKWLAYTENSKIRNLQDLYRKRMTKRGWEGRFVNLAKLEAEVNPIVGHMANNGKGTMQFEFSLHSSNSRVLAGINMSSDVTEITDPNGRFPYLSYLNPERNFFTRDSIWMASLYDPTTGKRIATLDTYNASGISLIDAKGNFISGTALANADFISKLVGDIYTFSQGQIAEGTRTADRSSTYLQHPSKIANPSVYLEDGKGLHTHSGKHYIDIPYFLLRGGEKETKGRKFTKKILFLKLKNELDRINYMKALPKNSSEHNKITGSGKKYSEEGKQFVMFHGVLREGTKKKLSKVNTSDRLYDYLKENDPTLLNSIESDMDMYLNTLRDSLVKKIDNTGYPISSLVELFTQKDPSGKTLLERYSVRPTAGSVYSEKEFELALVDAYISNQWIHNAEEQAFFYGDPAIYKGAMDYVKRITGAPSTGTGFLNDPSAIDSANNDLGDLTPYANSEWFAKSGEPSPKEKKQYNGVLQTAVIEDPIYKSIYTDQIKQRIREEEEPILKASGRYTQKEIDELLDSMIDNSYGEIVAPDGEGIMAFDSYRLLSFLSNEGWSDQQEELFMKIVNNKPFTHREVLLIFPPLKLQMFGALATEGAPISGFHKFALFPAIPTMFKGYPAEKLHNKMVSQGMDYVLFKSASKSAYLGQDGKADLYFTNKDNVQHAFTADDYTFTNNPVYVEYLKNQMSVPKEYKRLATFAAQFRRLATIGLMSDGVPVDFEPKIEDSTERKKAWKSLSEKEKLKSKGFSQSREFNNAVKDLNKLKQAELSFDITDDKGELNLEKFLKVARKEFGRLGLGEHEEIFLDQLENGQLRYSLDMSPSMRTLQGIIMSMLERRLIKQKFPGEGLYQMSSVLFEPPITPGLTQDEEYKKGTNGLSFYHFDKNGNYQGWVDVRISLQGDFEKLLGAIHRDGKKIKTVERLNETIKDPVWLADRKNVRMITFLSPRIPGQDKASYDVCRVKHFFGKEAGPIIQGPVEWLPKKGIDFDIDKEFTLFPRITKNDKGVPVLAAFSDEDAKKLWKRIRSSTTRGSGLNKEGVMTYADPEIDRILIEMFNLQDEPFTEEETMVKINRIKGLSLKEFSNKMALYSAENRLIESIENILSDPASYVDLVRPNGAYYFAKLAKILAPYTVEFNTSFNVFGKDYSKPSFTRTMEPEPNLYWHQSISIGMADLGIAAVDNAASMLFLESGAPMRPMTSISQGSKSFDIAQVIYLPHHTVDYNGKPAISISNLKNVEGFKTNQYSAQMITILVDIVKNPELMTKLGINRHNFSVFSYLAIRVGTPLEMVGYFINNPLVRDYIKMKAAVGSPMSSTLGIAPDAPAFAESKARDLIMQKYGILGSGKVYNFNKETFYDLIKEAMDARSKPEFTEEELFGQLVKKKEADDKGEVYRPNRLDQLVLLHYFEIEDQNKDLTGLKLGLRFDTALAKDMSVIHSRKQMLEMAKVSARYTPEMITDVMDNSFIAEFDLEEFLEKNIAPLFPVVEHKAITDFTMKLLSNKKDFRTSMQIVGAERPVDVLNGFKNDLPSFIYQNLLKGFHPGKITTYKGLDVEKVEDPASTQINKGLGVAVDQNKLYINISQIKDLFKMYKEGKKSSETKELKIQNPPTTALISFNEFSHFVIEREYLRSFMKPSDLVTDPYYTEGLRYIRDTMTGVSPEVAEKMAYEGALKNMALNNIFNNWQLFESENAYALEYGRIVNNLKKKYPTVIDTYPVLQHLVPSPLGTSDNPLMWNLKQQVIILTKEDRELFHENLQALANPSVIKITDNLKENTRLSDFFRRLPFVAMLQSGKADTEFGLGRIIPKEDYLVFIEQGFKQFKGVLDRIHDNKMDPEILQIAFDKYITANNVEYYAHNQRSKDYLVTNANINQLRLSKTKEKLLAAPAQGDLYIMTDSAADTIVLAQSNPDIIFAYNGKKGNPSIQASNATSGDGMFGQREITNSVGLALYDYYGKEAKAVTDNTLEDNMKAIDQWIDTLKSFRDDPISPKRILFNPNGYGQALIGADRITGWNLNPKLATAPETFYYLSRKLKEEFQYSNKNFLEAAEMIKKTQLMEQNINDLARDKIIECFK